MPKTSISDKPTAAQGQLGEMIIEQAARLITHQGYYAGQSCDVSFIGDVANACDIELNTLFLYFPGGKLEILQAVISHLHCYCRSHVFSVSAQENEATLLTIDRFSSAVFRFLETQGEKNLILGFPPLAYERYRAIKNAVKRYLNGWRSAITDLFSDVSHTKKTKQLAERSVDSIVLAPLRQCLFNDKRYYQRLSEALAAEWYTHYKVLCEEPRKGYEQQ